MMRKTLRPRRLLPAVVAVGLVASGCGSSSPKTAGPTGSPPTSPPASTTKPLIDLQASISSNVSPDSATGVSGSPIIQTNGTLTAYKTTLQSDGLNVVGSSVVPRLATSWTDANGVFTFHLRQGVKSCYGNELTAADVAYTIARANQVLGPSTAPWSELNTANVLSTDVLAKTATAATKALHGQAVVVDQNTVQIMTNPDNGLLPAALAAPQVGPLDMVEMQKHATPTDPWAAQWLATNTAGFGAYCLSSLQAGTSYTLTANPGWTLNSPYFKTAKSEAVAQASNRLGSLLGGQAQIAQALSPDEYKSVQSSKSAKYLADFGTEGIQLILNYSSAPWGPNSSTEQQLRQAISDAIPRTEIATNALQGHGEPWLGVIPPRFDNGIVYSSQITTDSTKAKALLAQAGYPGGAGLPASGLQMAYDSSMAARFEPVAVEVAAALANIGIKVTLQPLDHATYATDLYVKHSLPMALGIDGNGYPDAVNFMQTWYAPSSIGGLTAPANYNNPAFNTLYTQAVVAGGAQRASLNAQLQGILIQDLPSIPVAQLPTDVAVSSNLSGVQTNVAGIYYATIHG